MRMPPWSAELRAIAIPFVLLLTIATSQEYAAALPSVHIVGRDEAFASIQAAIDASQPGAVIEVSAGRFDERLTISKQVTLVGAGAGQTIVGPTAEGQATLRETFEELAKTIDDTARAVEDADPPKTYTDAQILALKRQHEEMQRLYAHYAQPVVQIKSAMGIEVRSLTITMPDTPQEGSGLLVTSAVSVQRGGARLDDCGVVGCVASGISAEDGARLEVANSLIAACWGTGISAANAHNSVVRILNCDVRNNYHYNIAVGAGVIEGCRISGSAWSGISGGATHIERNAIFDNARTGIYSAGTEATIKHNLIFRNGAGASCWSGEKPLYERNLFLDNVDGAFYVNGPCEPTLRGNLIVGSPIGVRFGAMKVAKGELPPATEFHIAGNVFWRVETPQVLFKSNDPDAEPQALLLPADAGNRVADPMATIGPDESVVFVADSLAEELGLDPIAGLSLRTRWPLTPDEQSIIPDDGTRDSPKWKMRPKR